MSAISTFYSELSTSEQIWNLMPVKKCHLSFYDSFHVDFLIVNHITIESMSVLFGPALTNIYQDLETFHSFIKFLVYMIIQSIFT